MLDERRDPRTGPPCSGSEFSGTAGNMVTGVTSPSGGDLNQLRQQYERLCDLVTRTAGSDPEAAERVLDELQTVSERIQALEAAEADSAEESAPEGTQPVPQPEPEPSPPASRIVSFRVSQAVGGRAAEAAPPPGKPGSWRLDQPPDELSPSMRPATQPGPAEPPAADQAPPSSAPASPAAEPAEAAASATVFSSAIRRWLERHRAAAAAERAVHPPQPAPDASESPRPEPEDPRARATAAGPSTEFARLAAAVERQAEQIERIMRLCETHQNALEALQSQIEERLRAIRPAAEADEDADMEPRITELREAVEEQRHRLTALAKTIQNLAQWLAAHHAAPDR